MCNLCYNFTIEDIILKQNNTDKEFLRSPFTKQRLIRCKNNNKFVSRNLINPVRIEERYVKCDLCEELINRNENYYSSSKNYDICLKCYEGNVTAKDIIETKNMKLIDKSDYQSYKFYYSDFGSLLYWVPIIEDHDGCHILINLNPHDKHYGKFCIQNNDENGCSGYFIIYDETITLDWLIHQLKEITDKGTFVYEDSVLTEKGTYETVIKTYNIGSQECSTSICLLMQKLKIPTSHN